MYLTDYYKQKRVKDGDIREFERLFQKYYVPLCRYADKMLKDMDTAEDMVQEFFYNFWKNRESFTPQRSLRGYMYRSVRNHALRHLEHLAVRKRYEEHVHRESLKRGAGQMPPDAEANDLGALIHVTLQKLPDRCCRIFRMNRFEGMKYHEIAAALSISVKTVEAEMGRALRVFRSSLKEYTAEGER
jgi:RNA polymerase sigma-70 factor (ECF subfamily)